MDSREEFQAATSALLGKVYGSIAVLTCSKMENKALLDSLKQLEKEMRERINELYYSDIT